MVSMPTVQSALVSFARVLGPERAEELLRDAAQEAGIQISSLHSWPGLEVEALRSLASVVEKREGVVSLLGLSLRIRCDTYFDIRCRQARHCAREPARCGGSRSQA